MERRHAAKAPKIRARNGLSKTSPAVNKPDALEKHGKAGVSDVPDMKRKSKESGKKTAVEKSERKTGYISKGIKKKTEISKTVTDQQECAQPKASEVGENNEVFENSELSSTTKSTSPRRMPVPLRSRIRPASVSLPITLDAKQTDIEDTNRTHHMSPRLTRSGIARIKKPKISLPKLWEFKRETPESDLKDKGNLSGSPKSKSSTSKNMQTIQIPKPLTTDLENRETDFEHEPSADTNTIGDMKISQTSEAEYSTGSSKKPPSFLKDVCDNLKSKFDNTEEARLVELDPSSDETSEVLCRVPEHETISRKHEAHMATVTAELKTDAEHVNRATDLLEEPSNLFNSSMQPEHQNATPVIEDKEKEDCEKLHSRLIAEGEITIRDTLNLPTTEVAENELKEPDSQEKLSNEKGVQMTDGVHGESFSSTDVTKSYPIQNTAHQPLREEDMSIEDRFSLIMTELEATCMEHGDPSYTESFEEATEGSLRYPGNVNLDNPNASSSDSSSFSMRNSEITTRGNLSLAKEKNKSHLSGITPISADRIGDYVNYTGAIVENETRVSELNDNTETARDDSRLFSNNTGKVTYHTEISIDLDNNTASSRNLNESSKAYESAIPKTSNIHKQKETITKSEQKRETIGGAAKERENADETGNVILLSTDSEKESNIMPKVETNLDAKAGEIPEINSVASPDIPTENCNNIGAYNSSIDNATRATENEDDNMCGLSRPALTQNSLKVLNTDNQTKESPVEKSKAVNSTINDTSPKGKGTMLVSDPDKQTKIISEEENHAVNSKIQDMSPEFEDTVTRSSTDNESKTIAEEKHNAICDSISSLGTDNETEKNGNETIQDISCIRKDKLLNGKDTMQALDTNNQTETKFEDKVLDSNGTKVDISPSGKKKAPTSCINDQSDKMVDDIMQAVYSTIEGMSSNSQGTMQAATIENAAEEIVKQTNHAVCRTNDKQLHDDETVSETKDNSCIESRPITTRTSYCENDTDGYLDADVDTERPVDKTETMSMVRKYIHYVIPLGMSIVGVWLWIRQK